MGERPAFLALLATLLATVLRTARELGRGRPRLSAAVSPVTPAPLAPPPIRADELLDKRGRPLHGAARAARLASIERARLPRAASVAVVEDSLLDKRGRPLHGAARAARLAAIERARAQLPVAAAVPAAPPVTPRVALSRPAVRLPGLRLPSLSIRAIRLVAITTTMTFVFATVIGTTGIVNTHGTIALGASTTLSIISGDVSARTSDADDFRPIADGAVLRAGMTIRTGPDAYAVLTYFEGSTVSVDPGTTLVIEALRADPDGSTVISMRQQIGRTWHSVSKLLHPNSRYEVTTPTATATVRGTMFAVGVDVDAQGDVTSTVETTEGAVATSKAPTPEEPQPKEQVLVTPGFQVSVTKAAPLEQPRLAPEPERKVTVTVGATAGLVLDPVGRANGIKDGKVVVQTPGAVVKIVDGKLVITLPNVPDGKISTVVDPKIAPQAAVDVSTSVTEKGRATETANERVDTSVASAPAVSAVDVKKGTAVELSSVTDEQKKDIASSVKVAEAPKIEQPSAADSSRAEDKSKAEGDRSDNNKDSNDKRDQSGPGGGVPGFAPLLRLPTLPPIVPVGGDVSGPALVGKRTDTDKKDSDKRDGDQAPAVGSTGGQPRSDQAGAPQQPKAEAPRTGAQPRADAPRTDAQPKVDAPKADQPKADTPTSDKKASDQKPSGGDTGGFVPRLTLPPLPFLGAPTAPKDTTPAAAPKQDEQKRADNAAQTPEPQKRNEAPKETPRVEAPRFEPPKLDLPRVPLLQPTEKPENKDGGDRRDSNDRGDQQQSPVRTPQTTRR